MQLLLQNCMDVVKPSVIVHVAEKYLQLAATNQHDGGSYNTYYTISKTWGLYWTLWRQNRNMVYARMKESAVGAPNSGGIFTVKEMKTLTQWEWTPECLICFVEWMLLRFQCITMLFAALRHENFDRWRHVGKEGLHFDYNHLDDTGNVRAVCTSKYPRVKLKNGRNPYKVEEDQPITIVCFCEGGHQPITAYKRR